MSKKQKADNTLSTPIDEKESIKKIIWYNQVISVFSSNPPLTTFLQIFFGSVICCDTYSGELVRKQGKKTKEEYEEDFYKSLQDAFNFTPNTRQVKYSHIRDAVKESIFSVMRKATADNSSVTDGGCNDIQQGSTYNRNKVLIYNHYVTYHAFYKNYISTILKIVHDTEIEGIHQIKDKTIEAISGDYKFIPTPYDTEIFSFTSYYLYNWILLSINSWNYKVTQNSDGRFSGLTVQGDINTIRERNDYVAVTEYYPVNTVERLGALEFLAEKDNIYALQELYFMYQNNTVLYNIFGVKRGLLLRDSERARSIFERLKKKNNELVLPMFRHDPSTVSKGTYYSELAFYRDEYAKVNDSIDIPDEERKEKISDIIKGLGEIYGNKAIPFNIELVWFINQILTDHAELEDIFEIGKLSNKIGKTLLNYEFLQDLKLYDNDSKLDLLELLLDLCEKGFSEKLLESVCCEYGDTDKIEEYLEIAHDKINEFTSKDFHYKISQKKQKEPIDKTIVDRYSEQIRIWESIFNSLTSAYDKLLE